MARRMFSDDITSSDVFLDMPASTQLLYFQLGMNADDDGFIGSPKMVMRTILSSADDYKILIAKKFILEFDSAICVLKGWRINNQIRKDRYTETKYNREKSRLYIRENGTYSFNPEGAILVPKGHFSLPELFSGNHMATTRQPSIGKVSRVEDSIGKVSKELLCSEFETFWIEYPVKKDKKKARAKFLKLSEKTQAVVIADVRNRKVSDTQWKRGYIPHPTTYLNGERWEDEIDERDLGRKEVKSVTVV